jgi:hypothetical protein
LGKIWAVGEATVSCCDAFIGAVRRVLGARQRVAFAVRSIESARQIKCHTAKAVFPVVRELRYSSLLQHK